jgi:hypothetical protein
MEGCSVKSFAQPKMAKLFAVSSEDQEDDDICYTASAAPKRGLCEQADVLK